jgi:hypothetical protein
VPGVQHFSALLRRGPGPAQRRPERAVIQPALPRPGRGRPLGGKAGGGSAPGLAA